MIDLKQVILPGLNGPGKRIPNSKSANKTMTVEMYKQYLSKAVKKGIHVVFDGKSLYVGHDSILSKIYPDAPFSGEIIEEYEEKYQIFKSNNMQMMHSLPFVKFESNPSGSIDMKNGPSGFSKEDQVIITILARGYKSVAKIFKMKAYGFIPGKKPTVISVFSGSKLKF